MSFGYMFGLGSNAVSTSRVHPDVFLSLGQRTRKVLVLFVGLVMFGSWSSLALAERHQRLPGDAEPAADVRELKLKIRIIKASKDEAMAIPASTDGAAVPALQISEDLRDLTPQLESLGFQNFHLVDQRLITVPARKKQKIALAEGDTLSIRPVALTDGRVCLWLKWRDRTGMELLDTRVWVTPGENMVTGSDRPGDCGMILALNVDPL